MELKLSGMPVQAGERSALRDPLAALSSRPCRPPTIGGVPSPHVGARHRPPRPPGRGGGEKPVEELIEGGLNLEVVQRIAASPATVFSYLVEPAKFNAWMGVGAELDPRPGGRVRIDVDGEHV